MTLALRELLCPRTRVIVRLPNRSDSCIATSSLQRSLVFYGLLLRPVGSLASEEPSGGHLDPAATRADPAAGQSLRRGWYRARASPAAQAPTHLALVGWARRLWAE